MKINRENVFNKYDGKCAFCGYPLGKGWHTWDIEPMGLAVNENNELIKTNTEEENLMPACKPCGSLRIKNYTRKMSIDEFKKEIEQSFRFLRYGGITATSYGRAIRFGLIQETGKEIEFYFEQLKKREENEKQN